MRIPCFAPEISLFELRGAIIEAADVVGTTRVFGKCKPWNGMKRGEIACNFPCCRELPAQTGSVETGHTAIQSEALATVLWSLGIDPKNQTLAGRFPAQMPVPFSDSANEAKDHSQPG